VSADIDKGGFPHYMLKEIFEQPKVLMSAIVKHLSLEALGLTDDEIRAVRKVSMIASGTSRHAGIAGEFMLERLARVPVEIEHASQYCYRDPLVEPGELSVLLSQSGTTADTLLALEEAKKKGSKTLAVCNVEGAPLAREADARLYTGAGKEVAVAATKSFTTQLLALYFLSVHFGEIRRTLTATEVREAKLELMALPEKVEKALRASDQTREVAEWMKDAEAFMLLGRDISYPIALEGALKLKETSYVHATGYPTGEMKHGPNALVDEGLPVVLIATREKSDSWSMLRYEKTINNLEEIVQRETRVVVIANDDDTEAEKFAKYVVRIPNAPGLLLPIIEIVPLQLLAYHSAAMRGVNVDRPRNLTKSVIVE
jgi:glucosamine--fructose-6-phosphate aminotransferase (isomerizing)